MNDTAGEKNYTPLQSILLIVAIAIVLFALAWLQITSPWVAWILAVVNGLAGLVAVFMVVLQIIGFVLFLRRRLTARGLAFFAGVAVVCSVVLWVLLKALFAWLDG